MSNITSFDFYNLGAGVPGKPLPERLVEGDPTWLTWELTRTVDGRVASGVWEVQPGTYRSIKNGVWEFCSILSGVSELIEEGQPTRRIVAGDTFVMQPNYKGLWRVIETTKKVWVTVDPAD